MAQVSSKPVTGFTIVELLVVIVVIGVLAAITIVSYTGITQKVIVASLQSDLNQSAEQLKLFAIDSGTYPNTIDCSQADSATNKCLRASSGNSFTYYSGSNNSFTLVNFNGNNTCIMTENSTPVCNAGKLTLTASVSGSGYHSCSVASSGQVYCWGSNSNGQLGDNSTTQRLTPVAVYTSGVLNGKTIKAITAGQYYTCAIASDNQAYCWGNNSSGQLGDNSTTQRLTPVAVYTSGVLNGKTIKAITAGQDYTCVTASDNQAYCWGNGGRGQLGNNATAPSSVPVAVNTSGALNGKTIKAISGGFTHVCVIASDDQAYCWGGSAYSHAVLGNNSASGSSVPVAVDTTGVLNGKTVKSISAGDDFTCAIASDNQGYCWGYNGNGQLGDGTATQGLVPVAVSTSGVLNGKAIGVISAGMYHTCAIASDNQTYCWGSNGFGQFGNNSTTSSLLPVIAVDMSGVLSGKSLRSIASSYGTCAIASDNQAYCWGYNSNGQLGDGTTTQRLIPVAVTPLN